MSGMFVGSQCLFWYPLILFLWTKYYQCILSFFQSPLLNKIWIISHHVFISSRLSFLMWFSFLRNNFTHALLHSDDWGSAGSAFYQGCRCWSSMKLFGADSWKILAACKTFYYHWYFFSNLEFNNQNAYLGVWNIKLLIFCIVCFVALVLSLDFVGQVKCTFKYMFYWSFSIVAGNLDWKLNNVKITIMKA